MVSKGKPTEICKKCLISHELQSTFRFSGATPILCSMTSPFEFVKIWTIERMQDAK